MNFKTYYTESEKLKGGKADNMSLEDIFKKHKSKGWKGSIDDIKKEFEIGKKVEKEHINDNKSIEEIVKDHLEELPTYYTRLKKMEKGVDK